MLKQDTITAVATPPGEGGIAIVRISGPEAHRIAERIFRPRSRRDLSASPGGATRYGRFIDPQTGEAADDGLLTLFRRPRSYTGEDVVELSCHGGRANTARILQLTLQAGARLAEPGEFTERAFLNGRVDLAQAEAVADVIRAQTEAARRLARRQLEGTVSQAVYHLKDELIGILAAIEVTIDFSDEVGELEYEPLEARMESVERDMIRLIESADRGRVLREGLNVAIVGRPNVGKSSLLNALLRAERAIVTPIAGTTRDLIEETAHIGGVPILLTDTAGIRDTLDVVERIGVERAQEAAGRSEVALLVVDVTEGITAEDRAIADQVAEAGVGRLLIVLNKCDLVDSGRAEEVAEQAQRLRADASTEVIALSAQTGEGLEALEEALMRPYLETERTQAEGSASVIVSNARHLQALEAARDSLREAGRTVAQRLPGDFIAIDVRGALESLGQITGETVTEDIIHRIFRDFCVGK